MGLVTLLKDLAIIVCHAAVCSNESGPDTHMELHQVRYFLASAKHLNFSKAARDCGVSPPSLLRGIRLLELEFGGQLFNRERSRSHLSDLGRLALPYFENIFEQTTEVKRKAKDFVNLKNITLELGIMCTLPPSQFVSVIESFRKHYPSVLLSIKDGNARQLQIALLAGELEAAIYSLPGEEPHELVHSLPLFREQMVIAVGRRHILAKKIIIDGADLNKQPYLERTNCEFAGYAERVFAERKIDGPTVYQSERDDWILAMAAAGMGYSFIPQSCSKYPGVTSRRLREPEFCRTVNLVTVRGRRHSPGIGALIRELVRTKWVGERLCHLTENSHSTE